MKPTFYHNIIRKTVVAFGTLFNEIQIDREDSNGVYKTIPVPIIYSTKEKFIQRIVDLENPVGKAPRIEETLPRMGFELNDMSYDSSRKTNTINKLRGADDNKFSYNAVPYILNFGLYIAARKIDDSLRIVEQIVPYFTPELTITIRDLTDFDFETNIPITLNSTSYEVDAEGTFDDRRTVMWSLDFSAKIYLYAAIRDTSLIKKTIINMNDFDHKGIYETYMAEIDPITASSGDDYTIKEYIK